MWISVIGIATSVLGAFLFTFLQSRSLTGGIFSGLSLSYAFTMVPLAVAVLVVLVGRHAPRTRLFRGAGLIDLPLGVAAGLAARLLSSAVETLGFGRTSSGMPLIGDAATLAGVVAITVIASVLIAPLVEESLFRGIIQPSIASGLASGSTGRPDRLTTTAAVAITALVFSATHVAAAGALPMTSLVVLAAATFLVGVVLGSLRAARDSIAPSLIAHATFNATAVWPIL